APIFALYTVATQVSVRRAVIAAVVTLGILLTVTAARNPFGHISGGGFDIIPFMVAAALFAGIAVANRNAYVASIRDRAEQDARPTQPAPGTAQLEDLIAGARRAGLKTTFAVTGDPVPLPAAVDLAAYRIIQESLTNTIRHAGPATAAVSLGYARDEVRIDVT